MTKFAKPKPRFDRTQSRDGVWFYVEDENGEDYGGFKCGLFDVTVPRVRMIVEREERAANGKSKGKRTSGDDLRRNVETFVEACLVDWDMKDEKGKPVPFSKEEAVDYFTTHEIDEETGEKVFTFDYAFSKLLTLVRDVRNFQSEKQDEAGDPTGN